MATGRMIAVSFPTSTRCKSGIMKLAPAETKSRHRHLPAL
jgi:hypothetical protein